MSGVSCDLIINLEKLNALEFDVIFKLTLFSSECINFAPVIATFLYHGKGLLS